jgi:ATP-binding cassette subfamily C exporter for protease/lipase
MIKFDKNSEIIKTLMDYKSAFCALAVFSGVINFMMLIPSIYMMQVYDRVLSSKSETTLLMITLITAVLYSFMHVLEWVRSMVLVKISTGLDMKLNYRIFNVSFENTLRKGNANPSQVMADLATIRQFVTGNGLFALFDVPWLPIYLFVAFCFHPILGLFATAGIIILLGLAYWNEISTKSQLNEASKMAVAASTFANNALVNADVIESMGMLNNLYQKWGNLQEQVIYQQGIASARNAKINAITKFIRVLWQSLALAVGALLVIENQISPGMMIACSILLGRALSPVEQLIGTWKQLSSVRNSYNRLTQLLTAFPQRAKKMALDQPKGYLSIEQMGVAREGSNKLILKGININVQPGDALAIVGPSASGKSTLARAIVGILKPTQGTIRIDGADLHQWDKNRLGPSIGYLPQNIELFAGSVAENISRFNDVDPEQVISAAKMAGVHDMILRLPEGYDTVLGAGGAGLSGGQKQRIALARALYGLPSLIVLDEPNSNLDELGETALVNAVEALIAAKSTVIVITHRPSILAKMNKLLVLQDGAIQLFGPKDQVLDRINQKNKVVNMHEPR